MGEYDFVRVGYVKIKRESERAILVIIRHDGTISEHWVPKSVLGEFSEVKEEGDQGILVVKRWWFSKNDIPKADIVPGRDDSDNVENKSGGNKWPSKQTTETTAKTMTATTPASASAIKVIKKNQSTIYYYRMCSSSLNIEINDDGKIIETSIAPDTMKILAGKFHKQYEDPSVSEFLTFLGGEKIDFEVIEAIAVCF